MGRFISADTIIPNPTNPQAFNRYSYCLNNPLKYIDPSGYKVEINGWDVDVIDALLKSGYYLPPEVWQALSEVINSQLYQAYQEVRELAPTEAGILESSEETYAIEWGNTIGQLDSVFDIDTNVITINSDLSGTNDFYVSGAILYQVYNAADNFWFPNFINHDTICDTISVIGDSLEYTPLAPVGYAISAIISTYSIINTFYWWKIGKATATDVWVSVGSTAAGYVPWVGLWVDLAPISKSEASHPLPHPS